MSSSNDSASLSEADLATVPYSRDFVKSAKRHDCEDGTSELHVIVSLPEGFEITEHSEKSIRNMFWWDWKTWDYPSQIEFRFVTGGQLPSLTERMNQSMKDFFLSKMIDTSEPETTIKSTASGVILEIPIQRQTCGLLADAYLMHSPEVERRHASETDELVHIGMRTLTTADEWNKYIAEEKWLEAGRLSREVVRTIVDRASQMMDTINDDVLTRNLPEQPGYKIDPKVDLYRCENADEPECQPQIDGSAVSEPSQSTHLRIYVMASPLVDAELPEWDGGEEACWRNIAVVSGVPRAAANEGDADEEE